MAKHQASQPGQRVAVLQSNYIPWKGYFDLIADVDTFVIYDQMQYTREDWRNRNVIKTANGLTWLTVPVRQSGRFGQRICDTEINGTMWARKHWKSIENSYRRAPHFEEVAHWLRPIYEDTSISHLSVLNRQLIVAVCDYLDITTRLVDSSEIELVGERSARVAHVCAQLDAGCYVSGPAAREYLNEADFNSRGISVEWFDYAGYPEYRQQWGAFTHQVSVLDMLFMCGPQAASFMKLRARTDAQGRLPEL